MVWQKAGLSIRKCLNRVEQLQSSGESGDYKLWQCNFLQNRLRLCLWLALVCLLTFFIRDLYDVIFPLQELAEIPQTLKYLFLVINGIMAVLLLICLAVQRTRVGQRYPAGVFLGLSWSITLMPQMMGTFWGFPLPDVLCWSLVFLTQAALIPVRWRLHLVSQLGAIAYYLLVYPALGLTTIRGESIYSTSILLYLFWFCFICNLAVHLYERLQQTEFESQRELQVFLNTVTHDLRTPVMGTAMVLQNLLKVPEEEIKVNRYMLERMLQGSDRQMHLLDSLLEAHSSKAQNCSCREPVHLDQVVQSALSDLDTLLLKSEVNLTNRIHHDLPAVNADPIQILRVFSNLIANALKHNPPGLDLTLDAVVEKNVIRCSVQDNGIGMSTQQCHQLFNLYSRGHRARYLPGLGLGLYLCRRIITAHRGQIGVTSTPGVGTTFWFTLPVWDRKE